MKNASSDGGNADSITMVNPNHTGKLDSSLSFRVVFLTPPSTHRPPNPHGAINISRAAPGKGGVCQTAPAPISVFIRGDLNGG